MKLTKTQSESILNILGIDASQRDINWEFIVEINKAFCEKNIPSDIRFVGSLDEAVVSLDATIQNHIEYEKSRIEKEKKLSMQREKELEKNRLDKIKEEKKEKKRMACKYTDPKKQEIENWLLSNNKDMNNKCYHIYDDYSIDVYTPLKITEESGLPYKLNAANRIGIYTKLKTVKNLPSVLISTTFGADEWRFVEIDVFSNGGFKMKDGKYGEIYLDFHSHKNKSIYLEKLENFVDGDIIINEINNTKQYILFAFDKKTEKFSILGVEKSLAWVNIVKNLSSEFDEFIVEEDLGVYEMYSDVNGKLVLNTWTRNEFEQRDPKEELRKREALRIANLKTKIISKLTTEEVEFLKTSTLS